jgi:HPt (histidine-containing phosphotransfer) domain-containing protein
MVDGQASGKPFDIEGLYEMYGKETVAELLQMSVDEARGLLDQIARGIEEHDTKSVMAAAHQLKGLASTMTINDLAKLSLELETNARQEQWETIPQSLSKLESEYTHVASYVAEVLA